MATDNDLTKLYQSALTRILQRGWADEVQYFRQLTFDKVDAPFFFAECSFCIYASGFSNYVLNTKWQGLTHAYRNWDYKEVCRHKDTVTLQALRLIKHKKKVEAILGCAQKLNDWGWPRFARWLQDKNLLLQPGDIPYIGPATRYHLGRNIGANVAKPDRYMLDRAAQHGYARTGDGVNDFASRIAALVGERIGVVDYVLWRDDQGGYSSDSPRSQGMKASVPHRRLDA
jgi:hypothetical protein